MKKALLLHFFFLIIIYSNAQPCLSDGIVFYDQAEINAFPANYPGCTEILGDVIFLEEYFEIDSLIQIRKIHGDMIIDNAYFQNHFYGLDSLKWIGGSIIAEEAYIVNWSGLESLDSIGGSFILNGGNVFSTNGMTSLKSIGGGIEISANSLFTLNFLNNLTRINGLYIHSTAIDNIPELLAFDTIHGDLVLEYCTELSFEDGFENIEVVDGNLLLRGLNVSDLETLSNLTTVNGSLVIDENNNIEDLVPLSNLSFDGITDLTIVNNGDLEVCHLSSLCNYINSAGSYTIYGNYGGCEDATILEIFCDPLCPVEDLFYNTQSGLDSFAMFYGDCDYLVYNISISSDPSDPVTNLDALNAIVTADDVEIRIQDCDQLTDITGLSNLTNLESGFLIIENNDRLISLEGLENLEKANVIFIKDNDSLQNISALSALTGLYNSIWIENNPELISLSGLENLVQIPGTLSLKLNDKLVNLNGLNNLTKITSLVIREHNALISLEGLSSLDTVVNSLTISDNPSLENLSDLANLERIGFSLNVHNNDKLSFLGGFENLYDLNHLMVTNNDSLVSLEPFPNLLELEGSLLFGDNPLLESLSGLDQITHIGGSLELVNNDQLISLEGLGSLKIVDENIVLEGNENFESLEPTILDEIVVERIEILNNQSLNDLIALSNIQGIEQELIINNNAITDLDEFNGLEYINGGFSILYNSNLTNLDGLSNVLYISDSPIALVGNTELNDISGIENIEPLTISNIFIEDNPNLSTCHVNSICGYFGAGNFGSVVSNAPGCNTSDEILDACFTESIYTLGKGPTLHVFPVPAMERLWIKGSGNTKGFIRLYSSFGELIYEADFQENDSIDLSMYADGMYNLLWMDIDSDQSITIPFLKI